ncbi:SAM-dependent methyltransferase [Streptomyces sp. JNUCC 64]
MDRPSWAPQGIDITVPSVSRIYDFYLGGSHNFEVDREAARQAMEFIPAIPRVAQANRAFLRRAIELAVSEGITQFLDIGSGIPTFGNVHEVAQAADPRSRVVYVDHDPVAVAHSKAVLAENERADVVGADLRRPREILASEPVGKLLDLDRPVALLLVSVLHFVQDADDPHTAVAQLRDALAPGSLLTVSHGSYEGMRIAAERAEGTVDVYKSTRNPLIMRSRDEIARFFEGYDMLEPGLVPLPDWRPETDPNEADPSLFGGFVGVGRKA